MHSVIGYAKQRLWLFYPQAQPKLTYLLRHPQPTLTIEKKVKVNENVSAYYPAIVPIIRDNFDGKGKAMESNKERAFDKMLAGEPYFINDAELVEIRYQTRDLVDQFNTLGARQVAEKTALLTQIFAAIGNNVHVEKPIRIDYGCNTSIGSNVFINFNFTVLDPGKITIGDNVFIGPGVSLYTALHPLNIAERNTHTGTTLPITIGNNVWLASDVKIMPGVTIGDGAVIGAGSVVTKDIPPGMLAVGSPAKVVRPTQAN